MKKPKEGGKVDKFMDLKQTMIGAFDGKSREEGRKKGRGKNAIGVGRGRGDGGKLGMNSMQAHAEALLAAYTKCAGSPLKIKSDGQCSGTASSFNIMQSTVIPAQSSNHSPSPSSQHALWRYESS